MQNNNAASSVYDNTNTLASPIIPKIGPTIIKPTTNVDVEITSVIKTNLLFSNPNNLEVQSSVSVAGIIATLIILLLKTINEIDYYYQNYKDHIDKFLGTNEKTVD